MRNKLMNFKTSLRKSSRLRKRQENRKYKRQAKELPMLVFE